MPDLSDPWVAIRELQSEVRRLRSGIQLENSSITNGRMRFIGGTLRVDSGGRVEIVGTLEIDGNTTVSGAFDVDGPWSLDGNGNVTGNVTSTGSFTQNGPWALNGTGTIAGNVTQAGSLTVSGGGKINVGTAMEITPASSGGAIKFDTGGELRSADGLTWLVHGNNGVAVDGSQVIVRYGARQLQITSTGIKLTGLPSRSGSGLPSGAVGADADGTLWRAA